MPSSISLEINNANTSSQKKGRVVLAMFWNFPGIKQTQIHECITKYIVTCSPLLGQKIKKKVVCPFSLLIFDFFSLFAIEIQI